MVAVAERVVNAEHCMIMRRNSGMVMRVVGSQSKTRRRIMSSSWLRGRMVLRNSGSLMKALKVASSREAFFQGFLPQVRLTRMTPSDQMSLGADA